MSPSTSLARLPGHFVSFFEDDKVVCSWKGNPGYTLLCFFEAPDPGTKTTECRNLLFLKLDGVVAGPEEAKSLAVQAWAKYRDRILAGDGEFVPVAWRNEKESG